MKQLVGHGMGMRQGLRRWLYQGLGLLRDCRAVTVVEAAFVGPIYIYTIISLFEIAAAFFWQGVLDVGVKMAARQVQIGCAQHTYSSAQDFRDNAICPKLYGLMSCSKVLVDIENVQRFVDLSPLPTGSISQADFTPDLTSGPNQQMVVRAIYMAPVFLPIWFPAVTKFNGGNAVPIVSVSAFFNEPFSNAPPYQPCP